MRFVTFATPPVAPATPSFFDRSRYGPPNTRGEAGKPSHLATWRPHGRGLPRSLRVRPRAAQERERAGALTAAQQFQHVDDRFTAAHPGTCRGTPAPTRRYRLWGSPNGSGPGPIRAPRCRRRRGCNRCATSRASPEGIRREQEALIKGQARLRETDHLRHLNRAAFPRPRSWHGVRCACAQGAKQRAAGVSRRVSRRCRP